MFATVLKSSLVTGIREHSEAMISMVCDLLLIMTEIITGDGRAMGEACFCRVGWRCLREATLPIPTGAGFKHRQQVVSGVLRNINNQENLVKWCMAIDPRARFNY